MGAILDEMKAERARLIEENIGKPGLEGAAARLAKLFDPSDISNWFEAEMKRGAWPDQLVDMVSFTLANMIANVGGRTSTPQFVSYVLHARVAHFLDRVFSGEHRAEIVVRDDNGNERLGTLEGHFRPRNL